MAKTKKAPKKGAAKGGHDAPGGKNPMSGVVAAAKGGKTTKVPYGK